MDAIGTAASIANLIEALSSIYSFVRAAKDAPSERKRFLLEISRLRWMLKILTDFLEIEVDNTEWLQSVSELQAVHGPIQQLETALDQLHRKLMPSDGLTNVARVLFWKHVKEKMKDVLDLIERFKTLVQIALEIDHTRLLLEIKKSSDHREYVGLLQWLSPANYKTRLQKHLKARFKGTAQWFLDDHRYLGWHSGKTSTLFCPGALGTGKSVIAAMVVEQLRETIKDPKQPVIYLYCDYTSQESQTVEAFLGDVVRQLIHAKREVPSYVYEMQQRHEVTGSRPPAEEWEQLITQLLSDCSQAYIVIDALDECEKSVCKDLLSIVREIQRSHLVKFLVTSRPIPTVQRLFEGEEEIDVRATEPDLNAYALSRLVEFRAQNVKDSKIADKIADAVVQSADGAFLLAQLHMDSLTAKHTTRALMDALNHLPSGSNEQRYAKTYEATMARIEGQSAEDSRLAKSILEWVIMAKRPLRLMELQHALAIRDNDTELDSTGLVDAEILVSVCAGLIVIVRETRNISNSERVLQADAVPELFVRLIHFSAKEYFDGTMLRWFPEGDLNLTRTCLTYLAFDQFKYGAMNNNIELEDLLTRYPLLEYTARYWGQHAKGVESLHDENQFRLLIEASMPFLQHPRLVDQAAQVISMTSGWIRDDARVTGRDGFHAIARYDLCQTAEWLLKHQQYDDRRDSNNMTALHVAAKSGSANVLSLLIEAGMADVNARETFSNWSPLLYAIRECHKDSVALLLGPGKADVNSCTYSDGTALFEVAKTGDQSIAELLIQHPCVDVNHKNKFGDTALVVALKNGHRSIAKLLLSSRKLNSSDEIWGHEQIARTSSTLDRNTLYQLLTDARAHEAPWRRRHGCTIEVSSGLGSCWYLAQRIRHCQALEPTGGFPCGSLCFCCQLRERCRRYIDETQAIDTQSEGTDADEWFAGLLNALDPWLLRNSEVIQTITAAKYLLLVEFRLSGILCDICNTPAVNGGYHCEQCHDDRFDACSDCGNRGLWCLDPEHAMWLYRATSTDESIELVQNPHRDGRRATKLPRRNVRHTEL